MPTARLKSATARAGISTGGAGATDAEAVGLLPVAPEPPAGVAGLPSGPRDDFAPPVSVAAGTAVGCVGLGASENSEHAGRSVVRATHARTRTTLAGCRSVERRDDILRELRLAVAGGFELGQHLEA